MHRTHVSLLCIASIYYFLVSDSFAGKACQVSWLAGNFPALVLTHTNRNVYLGQAVDPPAPRPPYISKT